MLTRVVIIVGEELGRHNHLVTGGLCTAKLWKEEQGQENKKQ